jgi:spore maturation protein CgeB
VDTEVFKKDDVDKVIDVLATYTTQTWIPGIHPYRVKIQELIIKMFMTSCVGIVPFNNLAKVTNMSKIVANCNAKYNFVNPRVTETLACGSFLLTSYCDDLAKFGYKNEEHLVTFHNMEDFEDKVHYFLKNDEEREEIAENGMKFVRDNYSNKKRVEIMFDKIRKSL